MLTKLKSAVLTKSSSVSACLLIEQAKKPHSFPFAAKEICGIIET